MPTIIIQMVIVASTSFFRDRRAVTSVEYALIALLIVLVIIESVSKIGSSLTVSFNSVASEL